MVILQVVLALISVVLIFLQCTPVEKLWNPFADGQCWNPSIFNNFNYFISAYTTLTDVVLAFVPISVFWKLQMPFHTKLGVCIMMGLTLLSAVVTLVKALYLHLFTDRTDPREFFELLDCSHLTIHSLQRCPSRRMGSD